MKIVLLINLLLLSIAVPSVHSMQYATQDIMLVSRLNIENEGRQIDIIDEISHLYSFDKEPQIIFPGGAKFYKSADLTARVLGYYRNIIGNISVETGLLKTTTQDFLSFIVSADISEKRKTVGLSEILDIDISRVLPGILHIGATGSIDYIFLQTLPPKDPSVETGMTALQVVDSRAKAGLIQLLTDKDGNPIGITNLPIIIGEGSRTLRYFAKAWAVAGATGSAALTSAITITATSPPVFIGPVHITATTGAIIGAGFAFVGSVGAVTLANTEDDNSGEALMAPPDFTPSSKPVEMNINIQVEERHQYYFKKDEFTSTQFSIENNEIIIDPTKVIINQPVKNQTLPPTRPGVLVPSEFQVK